MNIMELLGITFTIRDLIFLGIGLLSAFIVAVKVVFFLFKRERKLVANLKRPIMIFASPEQDMKLEADLLRDSGFFSIPDDPSSDPRKLDDVAKHCLLVIAYPKESSVLKRAIEVVRNSKIPVIVYAKQGEIALQGESMDLIRGYYLAEIANSPLRLMNLIFSILSVYRVQ